MSSADVAGGEAAAAAKEGTEVGSESNSVAVPTTPDSKEPVEAVPEGGEPSTPTDTKDKSGDRSTGSPLGGVLVASTLAGSARGVSASISEEPAELAEGEAAPEGDRAAGDGDGPDGTGTSEPTELKPWAAGDDGEPGSEAGAKPELKGDVVPGGASESSPAVSAEGEGSGAADPSAEANVVSGGGGSAGGAPEVVDLIGSDSEGSVDPSKKLIRHTELKGLKDPEGDEVCIARGWLGRQEKGSLGLTKVVERFFVLTPSVLAYFASEADAMVHTGYLKGNYRHETLSKFMGHGACVSLLEVTGVQSVTDVPDRERRIVVARVNEEKDEVLYHSSPDVLQTWLTSIQDWTLQAKSANKATMGRGRRASVLGRMAEDSRALLGTLSPEERAIREYRLKEERIAAEEEAVQRAEEAAVRAKEAEVRRAREAEIAKEERERDARIAEERAKRAVEEKAEQYFPFRFTKLGDLRAPSAASKLVDDKGQEVAILTGWLTKKSSASITSSTQERFFVLTATRLCYFTSPNDAGVNKDGLMTGKVGTGRTSRFKSEGAMIKLESVISCEVIKEPKEAPKRSTSTDEKEPKKRRSFLRRMSVGLGLRKKEEDDASTPDAEPTTPPLPPTPEGGGGGGSATTTLSDADRADSTGEPSPAAVAAAVAAATAESRGADAEPEMVETGMIKLDLAEREVILNSHGPRGRDTWAEEITYWSARRKKQLDAAAFAGFGYAVKSPTTVQGSWQKATAGKR